VTIEEATPAPSQPQADLDARERELAQRQADLDARERELRSRERTEPPVAPAPKPRAPKPQAPKPQPKPAPRAEEPAPAPAPRDTEERATEHDRDVDVTDVDVEERAEPEEARPEPEPAPEEVRPEPVTVPVGTVLEVEMLSTVSSQTSRPGDTFRARINGNVRADGRVAIPSGSEVMGEVVDAQPLKKVGGQARLAIRFTDLVLPDGTTVPIDASLRQSGRNETGRDAATIGGGAAAGAILGRILNKGDRGKGAVIGAIIGAAAGTVIASRTPGEEVTFAKGAVVVRQLDDSVRIRPRR
jgi:type IV secretory pathway VirB10-like protein